MRLLIVILIVLAGAGGWLWWQHHRAAAPEAWQGYVDADYVKVGPVEPGQLTSVAVARGDKVAAGALLFTQDDTEERAARDQAARQVAQSEQQLANLEAAAKPTEIAQAEANLTDARATLERAKSDLQRAEDLVKRGNIAVQTVDQLRATYLSAQARVEMTGAALAQAKAPMGREREITTQHAALEAANAALDMVDWRLAQRAVAAPIGGRVADVLARPGETMAAGAPVVSILPSENIFVRFFVPEVALATLHQGDPVTFGCDGCPPDLTGTISFISPQAEYTPPIIYSESTRSKLVYLIEARPRPDEAPLLNPGQPMDVRTVARTTP